VRSMDSSSNSNSVSGNVAKRQIKRCHCCRRPIAVKGRVRPTVAPPSLKQWLWLRLPWKRLHFNLHPSPHHHHQPVQHRRPRRVAALQRFLSLRPWRRIMATPRPPYYGQRNVDPSRHSYTGGHIRQRLRNIVGNYVDAKLGVGTPVPGPATSPRMVHDRFAQEEESNKIDARDIAAVSGDEEKLVLFPTYARVKPHLFHVLHQHGPTSEHGTSLPSHCVGID